MSLPLLVRPRAESEIREASERYRWISPRVSKRFADVIRETLRLISEHPQMYPLVHGEVRRALTRDFPYALFFVVEPDSAIILRVIHQARDDAEWPSTR